LPFVMRPSETVYGLFHAFHLRMNQGEWNPLLTELSWREITGKKYLSVNTAIQWQQLWFLRGPIDTWNEFTACAVSAWEPARLLGWRWH
jgi:hypothetical protein